MPPQNLLQNSLTYLQIIVILLNMDCDTYFILFMLLITNLGESRLYNCH